MSVVLLAVAGLAAGGDDAPTSTAAPAPAQVDVAGAPGLDPAQSVDALQDRLRRLPGDWQAWTALGSVYLQQATAAADPSYYAKAERAFARSLMEHPDGNDDALVGQAALAATRHDFATARALSERALALNPYSSSAYGVLTDALVETGADDEAQAALQRMLDLRPGVPSYARASYSLELRGDLDGARAALEQALRISVDPADVAFAHRYLGELAFGQGDLDEAERQFTEGLRRAPASTPLLAGRARVTAARGDHETALTEWQQVVTRTPEPAYLAELGDLYASLGRTVEAQAQYDVVSATERLFLDAGADLDLEQSLFAADHGDPAGALRSAEQAWQTRRSVHVADAYAWALHVNGRSAEALSLSDQALRLGTRSASFHFHRGMIERAVGQDAAARRSLSTALTLNPHFSVLQAPTARDALAALGGPV